VSSLSASLSVPVSVKLRLCSPTELTPTLAARLVQAGASYVTLHARYPSTRRRRHGPADLDQVRALVESSDIVVPVISNGNVRCFEDIEHNLNHTGAAGVMVGEALLADPTYVVCWPWMTYTDRLPFHSLFDPDTNIPPILSCVRYIELCHEHDGTATVSTARMHVKHMLEGPYSRRTWYRSFKYVSAFTSRTHTYMRVAP
jgi:tRNA-dihydrouridine synthase 1